MVGQDSEGLPSSRRAIICASVRMRVTSFSYKNAIFINTRLGISYCDGNLTPLLAHSISTSSVLNVRMLREKDKEVLKFIGSSFRYPPPMNQAPSSMDLSGSAAGLEIVHTHTRITASGLLIAADIWELTSVHKY